MSTRAGLTDLHPDLIIDAEPVRVHIARLCAAGMSIAEIARQADLGYNSVYRLLRVHRVSVRIATAVLGVRARPGLEQLTQRARQQVRALCSIGWPWLESSRRSGLHIETFIDLAYARRARLTYHSCRAIDTLFDQLWDQPYTGPGSGHARARAARHGWPMPMDLD